MYHPKWLSVRITLNFNGIPWKYYVLNSDNELPYESNLTFKCIKEVHKIVI